mmetsp:Transcript_7619/g.18882  ORF Transcript_7619/g.18882 Transcript_7619/m.18882 type:complete len:246 (-) Transcript_7619:59-796(-)
MSRGPPRAEIPCVGTRRGARAFDRGRDHGVRHLQGCHRSHPTGPHHDDQYHGAVGAVAGGEGWHRSFNRGRPHEGQRRGEIVRHRAQSKGDSRWQAKGSEGRQCAGRRDQVRGAHDERHRGRRVLARLRSARRIHLRVFRAERTGSPGADRHHGPIEGAARDQAQDLPENRETAGFDQHRRHHRQVRGADGRARRLGRGARGGTRALRAEVAHRTGQGGRVVRHQRDAGGGKHDQTAASHPRGGF